jgi:hypothetical protein
MFTGTHAGIPLISLRQVKVAIILNIDGHKNEYPPPLYKIVKSNLGTSLSDVTHFHF